MVEKLTGTKITSADIGEQQTTRRRRIAKIVLWLSIFAVIALTFRIFGISVIAWLDDVWKNIKQVSIVFIIAAIILKTAESMLTAIAWRSVLRASYPTQHVSYKLSLGAYQGGVALNAIAPAKAGTWAMLGLFRLYIPGARFATLVAGLVVQGLAFTFFAVINYAILILFARQNWDDSTGFIGEIVTAITDYPLLAIIIAVSAALLVYILVRHYWSRVKKLGQQIKLGGAVFRPPRRYALGVFLPELASYACRFGYTAVFLAAFNIEVSIHTVFLVIASSSLGHMVAVAPGGLGTTQALDAYALRNYTSTGNATAYSLAQDAVLTAWNVVFGIIVMCWAFGWTDTKDLIKHRGEIGEQVQQEKADEENEDAHPVAETG